MCCSLLNSRAILFFVNTITTFWNRYVHLTQFFTCRDAEFCYMQAVLSDSPCDSDPYLEPAKTEEDLYAQLKGQNLKRIPQQEIE